MQQRSFTKQLVLSTVYVSLVSVVSVVFLWVYTEYRSFGHEIKQMEQQYIKEQKSRIYYETQNVLNYINYRKSTTISKLKNILKERVYIGHAIATSLYETYKDTMGRKELQILIKEALRDVRFKLDFYRKDSGTFFIGNFNGVEELYPSQPQFEGKNMLDLMDSKGNYIVQKEIEVAKNKGEGYVDGFWKVGEEDHHFYAFVKKFAPYNWLIGTADNIDDMTQVIQSEVLDYIAQIRFGKDGYIFVNTMGGYALVHDGHKVGKPFFFGDVTDSMGTKIFNEEKRVSLKKDGGYFSYSFKKLNSDIESPKIGYVIQVKEWSWIVGSGFYLDDVEDIIKQKKLVLENRIKTTIFFIIIITLIVLSLTLLLIKSKVKKITNEFNIFNDFCYATNKTYKNINVNIIKFIEFKQLADAINYMMGNIKTAYLEIENKNHQLSEMNKELTKKNEIISQKSHERKELVHILCHDLMNPVGSIKSGIELISKNPGMLHKFTDLMYRSAETAVEIIDMVRKFMALESGKNEFVLEENNLQELINMSVEILRYKFDEKNIKLNIDIEPEFSVLVERASFINSVISNLLTNAIKFSFPDSEILITAQKTQNHIIVKVKDYGIGIPKKLLNNIFNIDKITSRLGTQKETGTGFGMPLVQKFIHSYGGEIDIQSIEKKDTEDESGTEVVLKLKAK